MSARPAKRSRAISRSSAGVPTRQTSSAMASVTIASISEPSIGVPVRWARSQTARIASRSRDQPWSSMKPP